MSLRRSCAISHALITSFTILRILPRGIVMSALKLSASATLISTSISKPLPISLTNSTSWRSTMSSSDRPCSSPANTNNSKGLKTTNGAATKRPSTMQRSASRTSASLVSSTLSIPQINASMTGRWLLITQLYVKYAAKRCWLMRPCWNAGSAGTAATSITWSNGFRSMRTVRILAVLVSATEPYTSLFVYIL